jgi:hypothetical protein
MRDVITCGTLLKNILKAPARSLCEAVLCCMNKLLELLEFRCGEERKPEEFISGEHSVQRKRFVICPKTPSICVIAEWPCSCTLDPCYESEVECLCCCKPSKKTFRNFLSSGCTRLHGILDFEVLSMEVRMKEWDKVISLDIYMWCKNSFRVLMVIARQCDGH